MFGAQSTFGGFGQQQPNTAPAFGSAIPAPAPLFGSPAPAPSAFGVGGFGQPQQQAPAPSLFGQPAPTAFGQPASSPFGQPAPAAAPFGQAPSLFGQPAPAPAAFGGYGAVQAPAPTTGGLFGSAAPNTPFGSSANTTPSPFGAAPAPSVFGGPAFGQPTATSAYGGAPATTGGGLFGSNPAPAPAFGASSTFGVGAPSAFGAAAPATTGGLFGSPPAVAPFGSVAAPAGGLFGSPSMAAPGVTGTATVPYQPVNKQDGTSSISLHSISAMPQFENKSPEELRSEDYAQGNRGNRAPPPAVGGFGTGTYGGAAPSTGMFGSNPAPAPFGAPAAGGLFGTPAPAPYGAGGFGAAPSTGGGLFGGSTGGFGAAPAPSGGLFGGTSTTPAPSTGFGGFGAAPAPSGGGLFGGTAPAPAPFGSPAPAPFGSAPSTGFGGFGTPSGGGLFGTTPAPAPFGNTAPAPFGATPAPSTGFGGYGAPAPSTGFGTFGATPAPSGGLFGAPAPSPYGAPVGGSLFASAPQAAPLFGVPQQQPMQQQQQFGSQPQPLFAPNVQIIPPAANEVLAQRLRALQNQQKELEKTGVWKGSPSQSSSSTPTNNYDMTGSPFFGSGRPFARMAEYTPRSVAKVRPRGFPKSEASDRAQFTLARRDNRGLISPEAAIQSSQLKLVIRPDSLRKTRKFGGLKLDVDESKSPEKLELSNEAIDQPPTPDDNEDVDGAGVPLTARRQYTPSPSRGYADSASPSLYDPPASKSPGFDYYQQVIGDTEPAATIPRRTVTRSPVSSEPSFVPTVTKTGYQVTPSVESLAAMSEADLASVRRFSVSRPGYGKVEWEGAVDVRGADLDRIVIIESKDISVYEKDEAEGTKPEEGSKLNRPAVITFYQVFHKKGPDASEEENEAFAALIAKKTRKIGAEFISYDGKTGVWRIRVQHFSRYALLDDDTDDENSAAASAAVDESAKSTVGFHPLPKQTPRQLPSLATKRKATPFRATRIAWDDQDVSQTTEFSDSEFVMFSGAADDEAMEAEAVAQSILRETTLQPMDSAPLTPNRGPGVKAADVSFDSEGEDSEEEEFDTSSAAPPTLEECIYASYGMPSICHRLADKAKAGKSRIEFGRSMGRSFRVGWLPNGSFVKLDAMPIRGVLVVGRPRLSANDKPSALLPLLKAQYAHVQTCSRQGGCPLFALCGDDRDSASTTPSQDVAIALLDLSRTECENTDAKHAFSLLSNQVVTYTPSRSEYSVPLEARQMTAASELLVELSSHATQIRTKNQSDVVEAVFAAFSGGDVELACRIALNGGLEELGCALASGTAAQNSFMQLIDTAASLDLSKVLNPGTLRVLNNAGGAVSFEDKCFRTGKRSLDWQQRLELRILQETNNTLSQTLEKYENDIASGAVPYPKPNYPVDNSATVESLFYRLLKFCADSKALSVCDAVNPSGWTPFLGDFSLSFHLLAAICAAKLHRSSSLSEQEVESVLDGFEAQLTQSGLWEYAVLVALSQIGPSSRSTQSLKVQRAKAVVLRHFVDEDDHSHSRRDFLQQALGIPGSWFEEALCYRAASAGDSFACIHHALEFDEELGRTMFTATLLPNFFFEVEGNARLELLEQVAEDAPADSPLSAIYLFVNLEDRVIEFSRGEHIPDEGELADLRANATLIKKVMQTVLAEGDKSGVALLCPVPLKKVSMWSLAHEILIRMRDIDTHLDSVSCLAMEE